MNCAMIENELVDFQTQVNSVNNPPGQPMQDIRIETSGKSDGGQLGGDGEDSESSSSGSESGQSGTDGQGEIAPGQGGQAILGAAVRMTSESLSMVMVGMLGAVVVLCTSVSW
jgi:hypothetical protein